MSSVEVRELGNLIEVVATYDHAPSSYMVLTRVEARDLGAALVSSV